MQPAARKVGPSSKEALCDHVVSSSCLKYNNTGIHICDCSATVQLVFRSLSDSKEVFFAVHHHLDPIRPPALRVDGNEAFDLVRGKQLEESSLRLDPGVDADHGELALAGLGAAEQEHQAGQVVTLQRFHL